MFRKHSFVLLSSSLINVNKQEKKKSASLAWGDIPIPTPADLPRIYREVESLRLHNALDPKRFYKKEEGEGKGIKGLPKQIAVCSFHTSHRQQY